MIERLPTFALSGLLGLPCLWCPSTFAKPLPCILRPTPAFDVKEAVRKAQTFLDEPDASFSSVTLSINTRRGLWRLRYEMRSGYRSITVDAITGDVVGFFDYGPGKGSPMREEPLSPEQAREIALTYLRKLRPDFDEHKWREESIGSGYAFIWKEMDSSGIALPNRFAQVRVNKGSGKLSLLDVDFDSFGAYSPPTISAEVACERATAALNYKATKTTPRLWIATDAIGEERLVWQVLVEGEAQVKGDNGEQTLFKAQNPVRVDAHSGEVIGVAHGNWGDREPPLKIKFAQPILVSLDGRGVGLFVPPQVRGSECILPESLFIALCGRVRKLEEDSSYTVAGDTGDATIRLGRSDADANGKKIDLACAPEKVNNRLYLPLRIVRLVLGLGVQWNPKNLRLDLTSVTPPPWMARGLEPNVNLLKDGVTNEKEN